MKKIFLLLAGLFCSLYAMGQAPTRDVFTADTPKGATRLSKEQLLSYMHHNFKTSAVPDDKEHTYKLDGLLISYWSLSVNPEFKKSLQASESEILAVLKRNPENVIHYSKIVSANKIQFLVYEYQRNDEVLLRFQSEFNKDNKNINGLIQFKKLDEEKAQKALQDFLKSVHFKE